jgi:hypothetical protein
VNRLSVLVLGDGGLTLILSQKNNLEFSESAKGFSGLGSGHPAFAHNRSFPKTSTA